MMEAVRGSAVRLSATELMDGEEPQKAKRNTDRERLNRHARRAHHRRHERNAAREYVVVYETHHQIGVAAMKDNDASHSSILSFERMVRKEQKDSGKENDGADDYGEARARAWEAPMLDVVFTDGRIESFDHSLPRRATFLPEES